MLVLAVAGRPHKAVAQAVYAQLTTLPTLYVETVSGSDPVDKVNYLPCKVTMVEDGKVTTYTITAGGIRGRGNSTWSAQKKPWRLKFDSKVALIGAEHAKAKNWTLLANAYDKSLMRNALTYHLGTFVGLAFCPAAKFVDMVLNGKYIGTYQISDQMEVKTGRVPVDEDTGWLLEYANAEDKVDDPKVALDWGGVYYGNVEIKNPDFEGDRLDANPVLSAAISDYLNKTLGPRLVPTLTGYDYVDAVRGYRSLVDTLSLVNWYIATEVTANWDGFYSIYSYREADGADDTRLHLGPMWDYDLAYGNHTETYDYFSDFYQKLLAECNFNRYQFPGGYRKMQPVIRHLWDDPWFADAVTRRLHSLLDAGLQRHLEEKIDRMQQELGPSARKNFQRWSISSDDGGYSTAENRVSWEQAVSVLRRFVGTRLAMMKTRFETLNSNNLYLDDHVDNTAIIEEGMTGVNVVMRRPAAANSWTACCMPFDLDADRIAYYFGPGTKVAELKSVAATDGETRIDFVTTATMKAGVPYAVCPARAVDTPFSFLDITLGTAAQTVSRDGCQFVGTYAPVMLAADDSRRIISGGVAIPAGPGVMPGYSAYIQLPLSLAGTRVVVSVDGVATSIARPSVTPGSNATRIYTLSGQPVDPPVVALPHGVYIERGVKVIK